MKVTLRSERVVSDENAKKETGRGFAGWWTLLDAFGGPAKGRREIGNHLVNELKVDPWWSATLQVEYERHKGLVEKDGKGKGYTICATKSLKAPPERCWELFATGKALDGWFGPENVFDLKPGGSLSNADGNAADVRGVTPGKTIRLVWKDASAPGTPVEVKLQPAAGKTTVMVTHDRLQTREEADGLRAAWGEALDRLKKLVEAG
ncbi:MAG TPA: SRPBCC domain-containing protein [Thermoanaerobaculia bacterium]|nr:SRPBCC domain-containing protein [Thermoanaerobaculia bacterium]